VKSVIRWFAENGVAANLLMVFVVLAGLITLGFGPISGRIRMEVFPEISTDIISVNVPYPGASPAEVEEAICIRIEEEVQGLDGVKRVRSVAREGSGSVTIELLTGTDVARVLDDVTTRVNAITTFPEDAEEPIVQELLVREQVINVTVSGQTDERTLKELGEQVRDEITQLPGITQASLVAARPYEVSVELSEAAMRQYGLTFDEVANAIRRSSLDLPAGSLETEGGEVLLRTKGQAYRGEDFASLVVLTHPDGSYVTVGDVATVVDGFAETDQSARFDQEPAVVVQVFRVGEQNALRIADTVKNYVKDAEVRMPPGIHLTTWQDFARVLRGRMELLFRNGFAGLVLVMIVLALFLRLGLALWVSLGIPVSFMGAIMLMPNLDVSVNLISLFAFIVVLGIVVDDAIVVGESIFRVQRQGTGGLEGAVKGAQEVAVPVLFAVATTIAAFTPLLFVPGTSGKIFRVIPLIVIPTLVFSIIESQLILPHHLSHGRSGKHGASKGSVWSRFQDRMADGLEAFVERRYAPFLERALAWRYATVAAFLATLIITIGVVAGGWIKFTFFPSVEADTVVAMLTMPQGTPPDQTARAVARLEETAASLQREIDGDAPPGTGAFRHVLATVGEQPYRSDSSQGPGGAPVSFSGGHLGEVQIELAPSEEREISSMEVVNRWRERTGAVAGAEELVFTASLFSTGEPINVEISGPNHDHLQDAAERLRDHLPSYAGVFDVRDSYQAGKEEIELGIKPEAELLGLSLSDLARQVRQGFYGEEAQRVQRGRDEVKVMVRYPEEDRRSVGDLEEMRIRTPDGRGVPFESVARAEFGRGFSSIDRVDRQRVITVTADVDLAEGNANEINQELAASFLPTLVADYPGLSVEFGGQSQQQRETMGGLARGFLIALVAIYTLMAIPFRSYIQPLIIMSAIPFGIVGAIWGHVLMGFQLSMLSGFGIVALAGIVVNDNLVLVDFINRGRREGMTLHDAIRQAGIARFRPILLTSLTTFVGLLPMLLERSVQAQFLIPMAISLAFGVMFATTISLIFVPSGYLIQEDVVDRARRIVGRIRGREEGAEPDPFGASG
jgi:multidrug efflux pump subunit AcrB